MNYSSYPHPFSGFRAFSNKVVHRLKEIISINLEAGKLTDLKGVIILTYFLSRDL